MSAHEKVWQIPNIGQNDLTNYFASISKSDKIFCISKGLNFNFILETRKGNTQKLSDKSQNKLNFAKYFDDKSSSEHQHQLPFKYFVDLFLFPKLFTN